MRNNQPVTDREVTYSSDVRLITTTDLRGDITFVNDDFVNVSGFSIKELFGQHHNIIHHLDMPLAAFQNMWQTIQSGRSWKGLVKNRGKNGDYYWVAHLYSGRKDEFGSIQNARLTQTSEMKAVIARLENTCHSPYRSKRRSDEFIEQSNQAIEGQGHHVEEISSAMAARMLDSQTLVGETSARTTDASNASREATVQGQDQLECMVGSINQLALSLEDTRGTVSALAERNTDIGKVVDVITAVADQINLLALNAAIEAAAQVKQDAVSTWWPMRCETSHSVPSNQQAISAESSWDIISMPEDL